jgi:predicted nucleotidyltransferase
MDSTRFQRESEGWAERLRDTLVRREGDNLLSVVVYGSVARGTASPGADVDVLLVFRDLPKGRHDRFLVWYRALEELRAEHGRIVADGHAFDWSVLPLTADEAAYHSPLYLDMTVDARLLLDRGAFFARVLDGLRARMREAGSRRVPLPDGSWYWDLKPGMRFGEVVEL